MNWATITFFHNNAYVVDSQAFTDTFPVAVDAFIDELRILYPEQPDREPVQHINDVSTVQAAWRHAWSCLKTYSNIGIFVQTGPD